jgi:RHS repeat-associated protein
LDHAIISSTSGIDYYPFGSVMQTRVYASAAYRYAFNGKEKESDGTVGNYDFGARLFDGRLGRWLSVDPLAYIYPDLSSYCFVGNCPIVLIDPNGKEIVPYSRKEVKFLREFIKSTLGEKSGFKVTPERITFNEKKYEKAFLGMDEEQREFAQILKNVVVNEEYSTVFKLGTSVTIKNQVGTEMVTRPNFRTRTDPVTGMVTKIPDGTIIVEEPVYQYIDVDKVKVGRTLFPYDETTGVAYRNSAIIVEPNSQHILCGLGETDILPDPYATTIHEFTHLDDYIKGDRSDQNGATNRAIIVENKFRKRKGIEERSGSDH